MNFIQSYGDSDSDRSSDVEEVEEHSDRADHGPPLPSPPPLNIDESSDKKKRKRVEENVAKSSKGDEKIIKIALPADFMARGSTTSFYTKEVGQGVKNFQFGRWNTVVYVKLEIGRAHV